MKRFKVIGLCLVAVFALSAVMASGASAGQFGKCNKLKAKPYTGKYIGKYCEPKEAATAKEIEEGKKNKYEWEPLAKPVKIISEGGETKLKGVAGEIACKHGTDSGELLNATENVDTFTFYECSLKPFELPCKNAEVEIEVGKGKTAKKEKVGVIVTYPLKSKLIDHGEKGPSGKEPAEGEVWNSMQWNGTLHPSAFGEGPWLAAFECGPVPFAVSGSVSSVIPAKFVSAKLKEGKPGSEPTKPASRPSKKTTPNSVANRTR